MLYIFAICIKNVIYKVLLIFSYSYVINSFLRENILHQQQVMIAYASLTLLCTVSILLLLEIKNNSSQQREFISLNNLFCGI